MLSDLIKWLKDDNEFNVDNTENTLIQIKTKLLDENLINSELMIRNVNYKNSGVYKCVYEGLHEKSFITVVDKSKRIFSALNIT